MRHNIISILGILLIAFTLGGCRDTLTDPRPSDWDFDEQGNPRLRISCIHPDRSRATSTSFEDGDCIGLFVASADDSLQIAGNVVNNELFSFGRDGEWTPSNDVFLMPGSYNIFAYYPYQRQIKSVTDLPFSVKTDQQSSLGRRSGFAESDFLFASRRGIAATSGSVQLQFQHILSKLSVRLVKGDGYDGELPTNATIYVHNTVCDAVIDLEAGVASKSPHGEIHTITMHQDDPTGFSAIVVPQRLPSRAPLIEVVVKGVSYLYESNFIFKAGIQHNVNLVIDRNPEETEIKIGSEIINWQ